MGVRWRNKDSFYRGVVRQHRAAQDGCHAARSVDDDTKQQDPELKYWNSP
jgi:hypothetical protein